MVEEDEKLAGSACVGEDSREAIMRVTWIFDYCAALLTGVAIILCSCNNTGHMSKHAVLGKPISIPEDRTGGWGPVVGGLQCRVADARYELLPPDSAQDASVRVDVIVELRNVAAVNIGISFSDRNPILQHSPKLPLVAPDVEILFKTTQAWMPLGRTLTFDVPPCRYAPDSCMCGVVDLRPLESTMLNVSVYVGQYRWPGPKTAIRFVLLSRYPNPLWRGRISSGKYCLRKHEK